MELKLKWTKYCVLCAAGHDSEDASSDNIIFTIKDSKLVAKNNKKLSRLLSKGFEGSLYWNEYKTKYENKNKTNEYRYFLVSVLDFFIK